MSNTAAIKLADQLHPQLATGWNTWDTRSVLRHVLLPQGVGISFGFGLSDKLLWVNDAHFGRQAAGRTAGTKLTSQATALPIGNQIVIRPGLHGYDGSYSCVELDLRGSTFTVETTTVEGELVALITPTSASPWQQLLTVQAAMCWNRPGTITRSGGQLLADMPGRKVSVHVSADLTEEPNLPISGPYLAARLGKPIAVSTGRAVSVEEAAGRVAEARQRLEAVHQKYGTHQTAHEAMQSCLAWNVIYEPRFDRVLTCVARDWNCWRGGYAVFCWDTFFMAWMITIDHPALGYATFLEALREMVDGQFVPNVVQGTHRRSDDRSQPPVGAISLLAMHRMAPNLTALRAAFDALLAWNRWWDGARRNTAGTLSLGSHPYTPRVGDPAEFVQPNTASGAALESGLDNATIYDDAPFDPVRHQMLVEDVGLNALYVADCECLASIAGILENEPARQELLQRQATYGSGLSKLWCQEQQAFINRRTADGTFLAHQILTSFYPLFTPAATALQAEAMVAQHLMNPDKYFGQYMLPVCPRDDGRFGEQLYMRGRIWPPTSFLTYLGLRRSGQKAAALVARKSMELLLANWREFRTVPENYSAVDGTGGITDHSQPMYGWTGLMCLMSLIEDGLCPSPFD